MPRVTLTVEDLDSNDQASLDLIIDWMSDQVDSLCFRYRDYSNRDTAVMQIKEKRFGTV